MTVRIEIERNIPKLKGMKGRNMRGADGRFMVIHEGSEADAMTELAALKAAGVFEAPYTLKKVCMYDAASFNAARTIKDLPAPFRTIETIDGI